LTVKTLKTFVEIANAERGTLFVVDQCADDELLVSAEFDYRLVQETNTYENLQIAHVFYFYF
jgi:hypothetical protein